MSHTKLHQYCTRQKEQAQALYEADTKLKYDAAQAINAWDELAGQLHKPKPISARRFEKTKQTALRIVALIGSPAYRAEQEQKIKHLQL